MRQTISTEHHALLMATLCVTSVSFAISAPSGVPVPSVIPAQAGIQPGPSSMKQPAVYMLASQRNGTLYVGVTSDLIKRIWQHKTHATPGFTDKYQVELLVWFEQHATMESAITREKAMKKWLRAWKLNLIEKTNPQWVDLWPFITGEAADPRRPSDGQHLQVMAPALDSRLRGNDAIQPQPPTTLDSDDTTVVDTSRYTPAADNAFAVSVTAAFPVIPVTSVNPVTSVIAVTPATPVTQVIPAKAGIQKDPAP